MEVVLPNVDGGVRMLETDGHGRARIDDAHAPFASLRFSSVAKVRKRRSSDADAARVDALAATSRAA
jgi:hypothetical protein